MTRPTPLALAGLLLAACGGSATVTLEMENRTGQTAPGALSIEAAGATSGSTGRTLRLKLVAVYLSEDVDPVTQNNVGTTSMVWLNPECAEDIDECAPSGVPGPGPRVTEFFDFSPPTEVVNAALNSQGREVTEGTYRYARVEFCKYGAPGEPNLLWSGPGLPAERPVVVGDCARTSLPFDPPLELAGGDSVTVTLAYDLERSIVVGAPDPSRGSTAIGGDGRWFRDCEDLDASTRVCMDFPEFVPSAR